MTMITMMITTKTKKKTTVNPIPGTKKRKTRTKKNMAAATAGKTTGTTTGIMTGSTADRDRVAVRKAAAGTTAAQKIAAQKTVARKAAAVIMNPIAVAAHPVIAAVSHPWTVTR